ncbi:MAG: hypothetical protein JWL72_567 [Ilumatobacteraceae bacterium]|nr:hypothetical protein [Ilumatobacteraceae bacterium]
MGAVFVAQGLQSPTPLVPSICGGLVMLNTACAKGPLSAFRVFGRRMHRLLDGVVILVIIAMTVQPFITVDSSTRLIMAVLTFAIAFIWIQSDFSESAKAQRKLDAAAAKTAAATATSTSSEPAAAAPRPRAVVRPPDGTMADTVGRTAGRLAGKGVNMYREQSAKRRKK